MLFISSNSANISNAVHTAINAENRNTPATELGWIDKISWAISSFFGDGSVARDLEERNKLVSAIVDQSVNLKDELNKMLSGSDSASRFEALICGIEKRFPLPENKVDQIKYCFGYNAHDNNIVLRLKDGDRHEEIKIFDLSQSRIDTATQYPIPKYWVGTPVVVVKDYMERIKKEGAVSVSEGYKFFLNDANRQSINGNNSDAMGALILKVSDARPTFIPEDMTTTSEENRKLNAYSEEVLKKVNPKFNDKQKNIFFRLCSQDAVPVRGTVWGANNVIAGAGDDVEVTVTSNEKHQMVVSLSCKINLTNTEPDDLKDFGTILGAADWKVEFIIDQYGLVKCIDCEAPISLTVSEEELTPAQTFTIDYLKEMRAELALCFKDNALKQIHKMPNYKQTESYVKQLEQEKSWVSNNFSAGGLDLLTLAICAVG